MSFVEEHSKSIINVPRQWAATVRACWESCCKYDGIDPDSKFVVFTDDNPFVKFYDIAVSRWRECQADAQVFGYVGLNMSNKKAMLPKQKQPKKFPQTSTKK